MNVDEMVRIFREKYPGSNEEQVEGYRKGVLAEIAIKGVSPKPVELIPMPVITVPAVSMPVSTVSTSDDLLSDLQRILRDMGFDPASYIHACNETEILALALGFPLDRRHAAS